MERATLKAMSAEAGVLVPARREDGGAEQTMQRNFLAAQLRNMSQFRFGNHAAKVGHIRCSRLPLLQCM